MRCFPCILLINLVNKYLLRPTTCQVHAKSWDIAMNSRWGPTHWTNAQTGHCLREVQAGMTEGELNLGWCAVRVSGDFTGPLAPDPPAPRPPRPTQYCARATLPHPVATTTVNCIQTGLGRGFPTMAPPCALQGNGARRVTDPTSLCYL